MKMKEKPETLSLEFCNALTTENSMLLWIQGPQYWHQPNLRN